VAASSANPGDLHHRGLAATTVVSTRIRVVRSSFASAALTSSASLGPSTATDPHVLSASSMWSDAAPTRPARSGKTAAR
jgi:hypothetical protein